MRLVLASNNAKKLAELRALFEGLQLELVPQGELGVPEADEPHDTFIENALAKARHAASLTAAPAIADDSGLCVPALGGAPGVHSAVFAGAPAAHAAEAGEAASAGGRERRRSAQDAANNALLLRRLSEAVGDDPTAAGRAAYFACTLVAVRHAADPEPLVATGRWPGMLLAAPRGAGGFGYDPLLWIAPLGASVAELAPEVKNRVSHRAQAASAMRELLAAVWGL